MDSGARVAHGPLVGDEIPGSRLMRSILKDVAELVSSGARLDAYEGPIQYLRECDLPECSRG